MKTTKITPIRKLSVDQNEALLRAEYILKLKKIRDEIKELRDHDYLYSPNLPLTNVRQIDEHLGGACSSIAKAVSWTQWRIDLRRTDICLCGAPLTPFGNCEDDCAASRI
jgi:hypothetical protein